MRVNTNFLVPRHRLALPLAMGTAILAAVAAASSFWFAIDSADKRGELSGLQEKLASMAQRTPAISAVTLPSGKDLSELKRRVAAINSLTPYRGAPLTLVLSKLEELLPDSMWLASLHHRAREGDLMIVVEAGSAEQLTRFLQRLEQDPWFSGILLSKQTPQEVPGRNIVQSELRLKR